MWLFIVIGCIPILFGMFEMIIFMLNMKHFDSETTGTVIRLETNNSQTLPVYRYTVNGKVYETKLTPELYDKHDFIINQKDKLLYHAAKPKDIKLRSESYKKVMIYYGGAIIVGIAIIILAKNGILKM